MLIGYRHHVPNFFGKHIAVEKICNDCMNSAHSEILVSKENHLQFFLLKKNILSGLLNEFSIYKIPVSYDRNIKILGHKFSEHLIFKSLSEDLIKEQFDNSTIGYAMQFYLDGKTTLTFYIFNKKNKEISGVEEVHQNPVFHNEPLTYANFDKLYYQHDLSIFETIETLTGKAYQYKKDTGLDFLNEIAAEHEGISLEDYEKREKEEYEKIDDLELLENFRDGTFNSIRSYLTSEIEHRIINSYWLTNYQNNINFNDFKRTAKKPVITSGDKEEYLKIVKDDNKRYTSSFDYFFPTFKNWCGNFDHDMVAIGFGKEDSQLRVYFTGNDDMAIYLNFSYDTFSSKDDFLNFMMKDDNRYVTEELIDKLKEMASSFDY